MSLFKKISLILISLLVVSSTVSTTVIALVNDNKPSTTDSSIASAKSSLSSAKASLSSAKAAAAIAKCDMITTRIDTITARYSNNKDAHIKRYQDLKDKVSKIIDKVDGKNVDTAKLKTDLQTLDEKIKLFAKDYDDYINLLNDTKSYACGKSEGEFKASLEKTRNAAKKLKQDELEIRNFIQTTIKPDIQDIKDQLNK